VLDVARNSHVHRMIRPANYHIVALPAQGFCLGLRNNLVPLYRAA
jgi:hypothetical protein